MGLIGNGKAAMRTIGLCCTTEALAQAELAAKLGMLRVALNAIINGKRSIRLGTAMRLAKAVGTTPEFWINGQIAVDLYRAEHDAEQIRALARITPIIGAP